MSVQFTDLPVVGVLDQNAIIAIVQDDTSYQTTLQKLLDGTEREINKGTPDGYAGLDKDSLLSLANIPDFDADKITSGIFDESLIPNLTLAKIPDGLITVEKINAGGTRDNTTFLRGDGTWITVQSGGASNFDELTGTIALNQISNGLITLEKLNATGTKDNTTFLRGDNTFSPIPSGGTINFNELEGSLGLTQIPDGLITLEKLNATGTKDATTFLRGDNTFTEIPAGDIGANVMLSNLGVTAIDQHLNFAVNLGFQTPGFQILQQLDNLFIQTKNTDTRLFLTRDNIELDPNVATLFYNKRMGQVRIPLADDEAANKKYVDDEISGIPVGANRELSNLDPDTLINSNLNLNLSDSEITFLNSGKIVGRSVGMEIRSPLNSEGNSPFTLRMSLNEIDFFSLNPATANFNMNQGGIIGLRDPASGFDAANKRYVDSFSIALTQIPDNLITLAKLNTTGVKNNTTFLRGDGTFAIPQSGGVAGANTELSNLGVTAISKSLIFTNGASIRLENNTNALGIYAGDTLTSLFDDNGIIAYVPINMGTRKITALGTPTENDDAATKLYVDENSGGTVNFDELEGTLDNSQIPELEINLSKLNATGSDGGLMFVSSDGIISQIGNNATVNQILVWAGGGWQPRDQPVIPTPIIYADRNLSNLTDPVSFNQHLIFSVDEGEITFKNGSQVSSSANPRIFGPGIQILSPSGLNGLIITDTAIGFELLSENRKELHFGNLKLMNLLDPTTDQDAATKGYVDNHAGVGGATTALSNLTTTAIDQELIFSASTKGVTFALGGRIDHTTGGVRVRGGDEGVQTSIITLAPTEITLFSVLGLNMSEKKITNLATPTADTDAATKKYVDDIDGGANATLSNLGTTALNAHLNFTIPQGQINFLDGSSIRGNTLGILIQGSQADNHSFIFLNDLEFDFHSATDEFNFNSAKLSNVLDPTNDQDVATKKYVDDNSGGGTVNFNEIQGTISTAQYGNNTISTEKLQNLSITGAKIAVKSININKLSVSSGESLDKGICLYNLPLTDFTLGGLQDVTGSLELSQIDATGTRDSTTFLRGDGRWSIIPSGGEPNFSDLIGTIALNQIPNALITIDKLSASGVRDNTTFLRGDGAFVNIPVGTGGANQELSNLDANTLINQDLNFAKTDGKIVFQNGAEVIESSTGVRIQSASTGNAITINNTGIIFNSFSSFINFGNDRLDSVANPVNQQDAVTLNYLQNYDLALTQIPNNLITANKINQSGATDGQVLRWSDASSAFTPQDP